jgi:hypothetical protein
MAETQPVSSPLLSPPSRLRSARRPRLPHPPPLYSAPLRITLDETESLGPAVQVEIPSAHRYEEPAQLLPPEQTQVTSARRDLAPQVPPRTHTEQALMTVFLLGLGLTALVLVTNPALTRSDFLLGGTVLLAGVTLLALMELCRRTCPPRR